MWIAAHQRHLTNVERARRHMASSDECNICHNGPEDINHVLRFYTKARELWGCWGSGLRYEVLYLLLTAMEIEVRVCQVCRERNGVADKLASLGRKHTLQGRGFVVPPGPVVVIVAEEHECWDELRAAGASQVYAAAG
ncbi:hypothetical protein V6N12_030823 [Hibiscus sabdariffa]|uniref:Reverse transcriptase zinc-binding domain-containing protein n=1 Tax=Hibiscus sabdariffa TaxID=183260 RepID=A0ABR2E748_9ROSI